MTFVSFPQQDCGWSLLTFPTLSLQSGQASGLESAKPAHGKLRGTFGPRPALTQVVILCVTEPERSLSISVNFQIGSLNPYIPET